MCCALILLYIDIMDDYFVVRHNFELMDMYVFKARTWCCRWRHRCGSELHRRWKHLSQGVAVPAGARARVVVRAAGGRRFLRVAGACHYRRRAAIAPRLTSTKCSRYLRNDSSTSGSQLLLSYPPGVVWMIYCFSVN